LYKVIEEKAYDFFIESDLFSVPNILNMLSKEIMIKLSNLFILKNDSDTLLSRILEYVENHKLLEDKEIRELLHKLVTKFEITKFHSERIKLLIEYKILEKEKVFEMMLKANDLIPKFTLNAIESYNGKVLILHIYYNSPENIVMDKPIILTKTQVNDVKFNNADNFTASCKKYGLKLKNEATARLWVIHSARQAFFNIFYETIIFDGFCPEHNVIHSSYFSNPLGRDSILSESTYLFDEELDGIYATDKLENNRGKCKQSLFLVLMELKLFPKDRISKWPKIENSAPIPPNVSEPPSANIFGLKPTDSTKPASPLFKS